MSDRFVMKVADIDLVSTNDAYIPTYKGKRSFYRRSKELMKFQEEFSTKLLEYKESLQMFVEQNKTEISYFGLILKLILILPRDVFFYKRKTDDLKPQDTSNFIKAIEDQVSKVLGIDDKYNVQVSAVKCYEDEIQKPTVYMILECANYMDYRASKILEYYNLGDAE